MIHEPDRQTVYWPDPTLGRNHAPMLKGLILRGGKANRFVIVSAPVVSQFGTQDDLARTFAALIILESLGRLADNLPKSGKRDPSRPSLWLETKDRCWSTANPAEFVPPDGCFTHVELPTISVEASEPPVITGIREISLQVRSCRSGGRVLIKDCGIGAVRVLPDAAADGSHCQRGSVSDFDSVGTHERLRPAGHVEA